MADEGVAVRRRRQCQCCDARFTTFERVDQAPLMVEKSSGEAQPFDRDKVIRGLVAASKGRPVDDADLARLATSVEDSMRLLGDRVTSSQVGLAVLEGLRSLDEVSYLRFASVYKNFDAASDFEAELGLLKEGQQV